MDKKIKKIGFIFSNYLKLKKKLPEFLLQSVLLTLGVVMAVAIGNWDEDRKRNKEVSDILFNLQSEALNNITFIQIWRSYFDELRLGIDSVLNDQKPIDSVFNDGGVILSSLVHQKKPSILLQQTTWRTAQTTNLVQYFDYRIIFKLTDLYNYQEKIIDKEHDAINAVFLERNSFREDEVRITLQIVKRMTLELNAHHEYIVNANTNVFNEIGSHLDGKSPP